MKDSAINDLLAALERPLGNELQSVYRCSAHGHGYFSSSSAEILLLLLVSELPSLHRLREAYLSHTKAPAEKDGWQLIVATRSGLKRHLSLNPLLAHHLTSSGERIRGHDLFSRGTKQPPPGERVAFLAREAMEASAALAPDLLSAEAAAGAKHRLFQLAAHLSPSPPSNTDPAAKLFTLVQIHLRQRIDELSLGKGTGEAAGKARPGSIQAAYQDQDRLLVVVSPPTADSLQEIDWPALARRVPPRLSQLTVVTSDQLNLVIRRERPFDYVLKSFQHLWGADPLQGLQVSAQAVFRQAARRPSRLLTSGVPGAYLAAPDDEAVHMVVHDFQNQLLNTRLEHELLHRFYGVQPAAPEEPLPRRDEPNTQRIEAILAHCNWWAAHYVRELKARERGQKMSPP